MGVCDDRRFYRRAVLRHAADGLRVWLLDGDAVMLTEAEAKTKWCPHTRHANGSNGVGVNRVNWDRTYNYANCIGSDCMAWRCEQEYRITWASSRTSLAPPMQNAGWERHGDPWKDNEGVPAGEKRFGVQWVRTRGFCGLAGKP